MTERMSLAEFRTLNARSRTKYASRGVVIDHRRFDSKLEGKRYVHLCNMAAIGAVKWFVRQAPFDLPGGIKYRADFLVVWSTLHDHLRPAGELVTVEDCKGFMTRLSQTKILQVEELYGIRIRIITKENVNG